MKQLITICCTVSLITLLQLKIYAQQTIAQPYYSEAKIRFYNKDNAVAASPCYVLDLSGDINANWGVSQGINDVVIYQSKLFVSIDAGNGTGGVLVYNYNAVYPAKTGGPTAVIKPQTTSGLPCAGITIQPSTGNLFIGTFYTGSSDAGIYMYTATSGYSSGSQFASYYNDASIDAYIANLNFDASGNLWFSEFDGSTAASGNYLICYKSANKSNYYKIINASTATYSSTALSGSGISSVYLLSQPEGVAADRSGNIWLANNNDNYACNAAGEGTVIKIKASWITGTLFSQPYGSAVTVPAANVSVYYIPSGKPGGLFFDSDTLYINDQGQNQGSSYTSNGTVWKYTSTAAFNSTYCKASGIHTTYPGNGLMATDNSLFSLASDCVSGSLLSSEKNILTFSISGQIGSSAIDTLSATVSLVMPSSANLSSLTPVITVSPHATINPVSGIAENFSSSRTYTVKAQDSTSKVWTINVSKQASGGTGTASARAASLGKGMNLSVWLENEYWFGSTTTFPEPGRFSESDIINLKNLCFESVRLPVIFEGFAAPTTPYAFNLSNLNVVNGLSYVDSVIKWCSDHNMMLVIDNHIADDNGSTYQTNYQITNSNFTTQAALIASVWRQVIARFGYTDPEKVVFELRNEPNVVSEANLKTVYQIVIDTIRKYDQRHTLVVGCSGYYDPLSLAASTPYPDTNLIYTTHIYDGDGYYGFCEQGIGGVPATDSIAGTHISFPVSGQIAEIDTEMQRVWRWSRANHVPVWLSEFGCTTLSEVYRDDTSRCNYIHAMADQVHSTGMPWSYWDGYGPTDYYSGFGSSTPLYYGFSIFDNSGVLSAAHLNPCFASSLGIGGACNTAISQTEDSSIFSIFPNPSRGLITLKTTFSGSVDIADISGRSLLEMNFEKGEMVLNLSDLSAGVYFLRLQSDHCLVKCSKFIIEK